MEHFEIYSSCEPQIVHPRLSCVIDADTQIGKIQMLTDDPSESGVIVEFDAKSIPTSGRKQVIDVILNIVRDTYFGTYRVVSRRHNKRI